MPALSPPDPAARDPKVVGHPAWNATHTDWADRTVDFLGSKSYLVWQTVAIALWIAAGGGWALGFDKYPFIALTGILSLQAAYAAPLILFAGNKAELRDRVRDDLDYQHNLLALKILKQLAHIEDEVEDADGAGGAAR